MFYTNSRGTVIGMGAVLMAFGYRRFHSLPGTLVGATAVLALLMFGPSRTSAMDGSDSSAQSRVEAWGEGLGLLKANPVFGVGFGRFLEFHYKVAHNSIVHTFSELGLFGAFFLVGAYYGFFRAIRSPEAVRANGSGGVALVEDAVRERGRRDGLRVLPVAPVRRGSVHPAGHGTVRRHHGRP